LLSFADLFFYYRPITKSNTCFKLFNVNNKKLKQKKRAIELSMTLFDFTFYNLLVGLSVKDLGFLESYSTIFDSTSSSCFVPL